MTERAKDVWGNDIIPPDYTGYDDPDFDGEEMLDVLLGYTE